MSQTDDRRQTDVRRHIVPKARPIVRSAKNQRTQSHDMFVQNMIAFSAVNISQLDFTDNKQSLPAESITESEQTTDMTLNNLHTPCTDGKAQITSIFTRKFTQILYQVIF